MTRLPAVFVSHGSPMLPLEPGTAGPMLEALGRELGEPRAIVALSPHWMARTPVVGAHPKPPTLHDFGGFDPALFNLHYPVAGDPALASEVRATLNRAGLVSLSDPARGLDHGIWVPLRLLFPKANVPVVPLAMPWPSDVTRSYTLGQALTSFRDQGVLLFGTGSLTHNLIEFRPNATPADPVDPYVEEFTVWFQERLAARDRAALFNYRKLAPHAERAHPTDDHLLPLYWAMGAGGEDAVAHYHAGGVHYGNLAMDAWTFS